MSKKVVVAHYDHVFCGYHSDTDYVGNAIFGNFLICAAYVSPKKAKKVLADYARKKGLEVSATGEYAFYKPRNPNYPSEHEFLSIFDPAIFLIEFGVLQGDILQAKAAIGQISKKDQSKYDLHIQEYVDSYDPY